MAPRATAASSVMATEESTRASSSRARPSANRSPSMPPNSAGNGSPNRPSLAILATRSYGKLAALVVAPDHRPHHVAGEGGDSLAQFLVLIAQRITDHRVPLTGR